MTFFLYLDTFIWKSMPSYNDSTELCAVGKLDNTCFAFSAALRNFATDLLFSPQLHFHCLQKDFNVKYYF